MNFRDQCSRQKEDQTSSSSPVRDSPLKLTLEGGCKEPLATTGMWDALQTFVGGFIVIALSPP